jgi:hypothetical protein
MFSNFFHFFYCLLCFRDFIARLSGTGRDISQVDKALWRMSEKSAPFGPAGW